MASWLPALSAPIPRARVGVVRARWLGHFATTSLAAAPAMAGSADWTVLWAPAIGVASNFFFALRPPASERALNLSVGALLLLDLGLTGWVLGATGGASNPFSLVLLWWVLIGALVLPPAGAAVVTVGSIAAYGMVYAATDPHAHHHADMGAHFFGMWAAFAAVAPVVAGAIAVARRAMVDAQREHDEAQRSSERATRAAALTTLAAGAAHQLATPLSSIAVDVVELRSRIGATPELDHVRDELHHCRQILRQLAADLGAGMGEPSARVTIGAIVDLALEQIPDGHRVEIEDEAALAAEIEGMPRLLATAVANVLRNAMLASAPEATVSLDVRVADHRVTITIVDRGAGMDGTTLARAGEPFFTTRSKGLGLGLFVARSAVEQSGGRFRIESTPGTGTRVEMTLKAAP